MYVDVCVCLCVCVSVHEGQRALLGIIIFIGLEFDDYTGWLGFPGDPFVPYPAPRLQAHATYHSWSILWVVV